MTVGTACRDSAEAIAWQRHRAVMLASAATTGGNGLLRLHEGQSKTCKLQEKLQTGKQPSHEQKDFTTSRSCAGVEYKGQWHPRMIGRIRGETDAYRRR